MMRKVLTQSVTFLRRQIIILMKHFKYQGIYFKHSCLV